MLKKHAVERGYCVCPWQQFTVVTTETVSTIGGIPDSCEYGRRLVNCVLSLPGLEYHKGETLPKVHWQKRNTTRLNRILESFFVVVIEDTFPYLN